MNDVLCVRCIWHKIVASRVPGKGIASISSKVLERFAYVNVEGNCSLEDVVLVFMVTSHKNVIKVI
jgi:hypothetical protein